MDAAPLVEVFPAHALEAPKAFDWKNPDYVPILAKRARIYQALLADPVLVSDFKLHYKHNPWDKINDWGMTIDPRAVGAGDRTAVMPFVLFPKQVEWCKWFVDRWHAKEPGVTEKSRDCGISWLFMTMATTLCLDYANINIGVGSAKEDKVDRNGDPDCLFYKARFYIRHLPWFFRGGWHPKRNSQHMVLTFPQTGSSITGEAGDNIGRGGRTAIYGVDESAHIEHPKLIDASLSATTNCRIDISSVNGTANSFAERAHNPAIKKFTFHWRDDPRKDQAWYDAKCKELDPVIVAQELDINYSASVAGVIIEQAWVTAAMEMHKILAILGVVPEGKRTGALDVADQGRDKCAFAERHDFVLDAVTSWRGHGQIDGRQWDISDTVAKAYNLSDAVGITAYVYDADGIGADCRSHARIAQAARDEARMPRVTVTPWRGSAGVIDPEKPFPGTQVKAIDYFANYKAQSWFWLRQLFRKTYAAWLFYRDNKVLPEGFDASKIIVINEAMPECRRLCMQLSQPVFCQTVTGKMGVEKQPDEMPSPDLADSVMMVFSPKRMTLVVKDSHLQGGQ